MFKKLNSTLSFIVLSGFLIRILFYFFGAPFYFGTKDFMVGGDTFWWVDNIKNLIEHGVYTSEIGSEYGYFTRTPGYSFFIGFFYLITSKDIILAYKLIVFTQIVLDSFSIFLIYKISDSIFQNKRIALLSASIYAFYPFIIIWNSVVYAESLSIFLMLLSLFLMIRSETKIHWSISGFVMALAVLTRIQLIVIIPILICVLIFLNIKNNKKLFNASTILFSVFLITIYGFWPLRNYVNHGKLIFAQHLGDKYHWSPDYMHYMYYIWSVKTDHEPQFTQIMRNEHVDFPAASYKVPGDSLLLDKAVNLMRTCGEGVSYFKRTAGYSTTVVKSGEDCNDEIIKILQTLIDNQKKYNAWNYHILVPLSNLKKAIFKSQLKSEKRGISSIVPNLLFTYRTFLIFSGILGLLMLYINEKKIFFNPIIFISLTYFFGWYAFICYYYRNMEIRFLLHADILLILPASWFFYYLFKRYKERRAIPQAKD